MNSVDISAQRTTPSTVKLILMSVCSAIFTLLTIYLLILPASYGLDPTGIGAKLGITKNLTGVANHAAISGVHVAKTERQTAVPVAETLSTTVVDGLPEQRSEYIERVVLPNQRLELKFAMERDYELDYHWQTDGKPLYTELQGLKKAADAQQMKVFGKITESKGKGFFIAPFNGIFSLIWKNDGIRAAKLRLNLKGSYKVLS